MQQWYTCPQCGQYIQYGQPQCLNCGHMIYWQQPAQSQQPVYNKLYESQYKRHKKSTLMAYILWLLLGWHYAYLGKWGVQFLFWITIGGLMFWWLIDAFRIPGMVKDYNEDRSIDAMIKAKALT